MASANEWELKGEYFETCSCDYLCPCLPSNLAGKPTKGWCVFAMVFRIDEGHVGAERLQGLTFAVIGRTPGVMLEGSWEVGAVVDRKATPAQQNAIATIVGGKAGGPLANLTPLIGKFLGLEAQPIEFKANGLERSVSIPGVLDQAVMGVAAGTDPSQPMHIDGTMHPANSRLGLARSTRSHLRAFGIDWDDTSGKNNGHFAPFAWKGTVPAELMAASAGVR